MNTSKPNILLTFWFFLVWFSVTIGMWALAFWPIETNSEWLASAQVVCFGTLENGMPDTYGWIKLICTPMALFVALYVVWPKEFAQLKGWFVTTNFGRTLALILVCITVYQGTVVGKKVAFANDIAAAFNPQNFGTKNMPLPDAYPRSTKKAPEFLLTDYNGKKFGTKNLKGKVTYLTFAFTRCSSICPLLINTVRTALSKSSDKNRELVIVSLDPWRETVGNVGEITRNLKLGDREHYLVGGIEQIKKVLNEYEVPRVRELKDGEIIHPGLVYVLDTQGKIAYTFNSPSPSWLVEAGNRAAEKTATA